MDLIANSNTLEIYSSAYSMRFLDIGSAKWALRWFVNTQAYNSITQIFN